MEDQAYCSVGSDNFAGGYKAASHLVRTGHRDLLFLGDTLGPEMSQRYLGFHKAAQDLGANAARSEEHTSELQSLMRISYAVFCLKKKKQQIHHQTSDP